MNFVLHKRPLLTVENLCVFLPTPRGVVRAVEDVSFSLMPGRTLGVVGESGCGKTMLGRAVMGLLPTGTVLAKKTRITYKGRDLKNLSMKQLSGLRGKEMAMVFQDPMTSLNPVLKIGRQIAEALIHHLKVSKKEAFNRAVELMESVGIPMAARRLNHYPHQLSGGLRQRVAIAIALACDPKLLIADEPTTALDVTVQSDILDLLARLQEEKQMAMMLISHDLGVVAGRTHETAVMYAGKIVEHAPTDRLFKKMAMPYSKALMDAIPLLSDPPNQELSAINGSPPSLIDPGPGCRFYPRCHRAESKCRQKEPPLRGGGSANHRYACWYPLG